MDVSPTGGAADSRGLAMAEPAARWVLLATILGSGMALLDGTVVNVALPSIGEDLGADVAGLQWTLNGYLLPLAALILVGGAFGDRYGRRRVFVVGVVWFAAASVLCALAPSTEVLVAARALQGIGGALLTPNSLAIIQASFRREDRGTAIGAWSALGGIAAAIGPLLGGYLVDAVSWRAVFLINLPMAAVVLVAAQRVPESRDDSADGRPDLAGALGDLLRPVPHGATRQVPVHRLEQHLAPEVLAPHAAEERKPDVLHMASACAADQEVEVGVPADALDVVLRSLDVRLGCRVRRRDEDGIADDTHPGEDGALLAADIAVPDREPVPIPHVLHALKRLEVRVVGVHADTGALLVVQLVERTLGADAEGAEAVAAGHVEPELLDQPPDRRRQLGDVPALLPVRSGCGGCVGGHGHDLDGAQSERNRNHLREPSPVLGHNAVVVEASWAPEALSRPGRSGRFSATSRCAERPRRAADRAARRAGPPAWPSADPEVGQGARRSTSAPATRWGAAARAMRGPWPSTVRAQRTGAWSLPDRC